MRYVIVEKDLGVFLGAIDIYAVFAKHNHLKLDKVVSFETEKDALYCVEQYLIKVGKDFQVESVNTDKVYIPVEEIIKSGLGEYTHNMMDNIRMTSEAIH
jgi:hypothetical protein